MNTQKFDFSRVLTRAWEITWKYKALWLFGILAGCSSQLGANSFNYSIGSDGGDNWRWEWDSPGRDMPPGLREFFLNIERFFDSLSGGEIVLIVSAAIAISIVLAILFAALGTFGRIGLIKGTMKAEAGSERLTIGGLFSAAKPFFWRVLGLNLIVGIAAVIIGSVGAGIIALLSIITLGLAAICLVPFLALVAPVIGIMVGIIVEQANNALVVEDLTIFDAFSRGWDVFKKNVWSLLLVWLALGLGMAVVTIVFNLPFFLIFVPGIIGIALGDISALNTGLLISALCMVFLLPILIVVNGIIRTFIQAGWTLTYMELTGQDMLETDLQDIPPDPGPVLEDVELPDETEED